MTSPLRRLLVLFDGRGLGRGHGSGAILESFGVKDGQGEMYFVQADRVTVDEAGRLVFYADEEICAAVASGEWKRILKGITLDDVKAAATASAP